MSKKVNDVVFSWSADGLSLVMSNKSINEKPQKVKLSWNDKSEIPSEERLVQIYNNYFDTISDVSNSETENYGKVIDLPFNKQLAMGFLKKADFDEALFRLGKFDISFPITKDNKLVFKAPKVTKSDNFGFGAGSAKNALWMDLRDKNS